MKSRLLLVSIGICAAFSAVVTLAGPEQAAVRVVEGTGLLAKADFAGALQAYTAATKADPKNEAYGQQLALLRHVIELRRTLDTLQDSQKWTDTAIALHTYYHDNKIYGEALALDRKVHTKLASTESAVLLARTELAVGMMSDAADLLRGVTKEQVTPEVRVLLGLALARQGQGDEARRQLANFTPPDDAPGSLLYDLACVQARLGDSAAALATLKRCFESTVPSQLDSLKARARECDDLASLKDQATFAETFAAQSKVPESKCSTGPSCGKCPLRTACGKDDKAADPGKDRPKEDKPKP